MSGSATGQPLNRQQLEAARHRGSHLTQQHKDLNNGEIMGYFFLTVSAITAILLVIALFVEGRTKRV
jgi:hypothetical protein